MKRFVEGQERSQLILLPDCLDDYVGEDNPVRIVDAFIDELDLAVLGFAGVIPEATGRPSYHPVTLLKIYLYGYLNRVQSSRRLERETQRNIEVMWLTGRLAPDFKTIADFRRDNGEAIRAVCSQFVTLCRRLSLFTQAVVAIDGSKFKAVNNRDKNFTVAKVGKRIEQVEASIARYLAALDRADRDESDVAEVKSGRLKEKIAGLRRQMQSLKEMEQTVQDAPDQQVSLTDPDARSMATSGRGTGVVGYADTPTTLVSFNYTDGAYPFAGLIADPNGDLFSTTEDGGANDYGTVFEITDSGFVVPVTFAGMPGKPNCHGKSVSTLAQQYGGLAAAAAALGYSSVQLLQNDIGAYCAG